MTFSCSLSSFVVLAVLVGSPALSSAQAVNLAPAPKPAFYAQLGLPSSSSSSENAFLYHAPAQSAAPSAAPAESGSHGPFSSLGIGFKIGTGGIGFDVATPLIPGRLNVRGGAGFFSYNTTFTASNDSVLGTLKLNSADAMVDFFPFHGAFRLSAGLTVYNDTAVNGSLTFPSGTTFTLGNSKYMSAPTSGTYTPAAGTAAFKFGSNTVPRFTLGWGNMVPKTGHRIRFETEIGIEYIGNPTVAWNITGDACNTNGTTGTPCATGESSPVYGPVAQSDITQEQNNLQNDLNGLKVFPVVSLGLSYKIH